MASGLKKSNVDIVDDSLTNNSNQKKDDKTTEPSCWLRVTPLMGPETPPTSLGSLSPSILEAVDEQVLGSTKTGTLSSARFNLLSTMVGGGSLSLPLAFSLSGNIGTAPVLLIFSAWSADFAVGCLVDSYRWLATNDSDPASLSVTEEGGRGRHASASSAYSTYDAVVEAALGSRWRLVCRTLVVIVCFFTIVGYCVLLRDVLEPLAHAAFGHPSSSSSFSPETLVLWVAIFLVTPLCTFETMTALRRFGAASMSAVCVLGSCVLYRSIEACTCHSGSSAAKAALKPLFPRSSDDLWASLPIFVTCYFCQINAVPIAAEFAESPPLLNRAVHTAMIGSTVFYICLGLSGSLYAACSHPEPSSDLSSGVDTDGSSLSMWWYRPMGNILLEFPEDDPLLAFGRACLGCTIALAFPMLVLPARDTLTGDRSGETTTTNGTDIAFNDDDDHQALVEEEEVMGMEPSGPSSLPLLENDYESKKSKVTAVRTSPVEPTTAVMCRIQPFLQRYYKTLGVVYFWSGGAVACSVSSIDVVWDLLGSSLAIFLGFLIPTATFLSLSRSKCERDGDNTGLKRRRVTAFVLFVIYAILMVLCTVNSVRDTFFRRPAK